MRLKLRRSNDDDVPFSDDDAVNTSIIDALNNQPPPYAGDWATPRRNETTPILYTGRRRHAANPPPKQDRPELHVTPPAGQRRLQLRRPSRGRVLKASRATLPVFRQTARVLGWRAFIPCHRPGMTPARAIVAIGAYSDKTMRVICQQTEAARGELWERAREYDVREAKLRRPLNKQHGM